MLIGRIELYRVCSKIKDNLTSLLTSKTHFDTEDDTLVSFFVSCCCWFSSVLTMSSTASSGNDPLNILRNPPSTVVKVQGTARDDVNGSLGIALQFKSERGRYVVHLIQSQTQMAIKPENLVPASTLETYQAQFQQIIKDPTIRQDLRRYYNTAQSHLRGVKPEYAAAVLLIVLIGITYVVGFTKTLMALSMIMLVGLVIAPDVLNGASYQVMAQNFPSRCREVMEQTAPVLRGRLNNQVAAGILVAMLVLSGRALLASPQSAAKAAYAATRDVRHFADEGEPIDYTAVMPEETPKKPSMFGFSQMIAAIYIYRTLNQAGRGGHDVNQPFSLERMMTHLQQMELWKQAMLAYSVYNVGRAFYQNYIVA
jgi:hypothetical protein